MGLGLQMCIKAFFFGQIWENLEFPENEFLLFVSSITFNQLTFIFCFYKYMTWRFDNGEVNGSVYYEEKTL